MKVKVGLAGVKAQQEHFKCHQFFTSVSTPVYTPQLMDKSMSHSATAGDATFSIKPSSSPVIIQRYSGSSSLGKCPGFCLTPTMMFPWSGFVTSLFSAASILLDLLVEAQDGGLWNMCTVGSQVWIPMRCIYGKVT